MREDKYSEDALDLDTTPEFIAARQSDLATVNRYVPPKGSKRIIKWDKENQNIECSKEELL